MTAGLGCALLGLAAIAVVVGPPPGPDPVKRFSLAHVAPLRVDFGLPDYQPLDDGYGLARRLAKLGQSASELGSATAPFAGATASMVVWDRNEPLAEAPRPAPPAAVADAPALELAALGSTGPEYRPLGGDTRAAAISAPAPDFGAQPRRAAEPDPVRRAPAAVHPVAPEPNETAPAPVAAMDAAPAVPDQTIAALGAPASIGRALDVPTEAIAGPAQFLQAGYFADRGNATRLAGKLTAAGLDVVVRPTANGASQPRWIVLVGPFADKSGALGARAAAPELLADAFPTTRRN